MQISEIQSYQFYKYNIALIVIDLFTECVEKELIHIESPWTNRLGRTQREVIEYILSHMKS